MTRASERARTKFQSTLPTRGETGMHMCGGRTGNFNPLSPHGERPLQRWPPPAPPKFQSTLPTRGETHLAHKCPHKPHISIHSPHTGRDRPAVRLRGPAGHFNPLSPHGERPSAVSSSMRSIKFQSTLPTRGETGISRSPASVFGISIHSPHTGRDLPKTG